MPFADFTAETPLVLVGAGKMGGALLGGWLDRGLDPRAVIVVDPAPPAATAAILADKGIGAVKVAPAGTKARVLTVAVKPQVIGAVLPELRRAVGPGSVVLSIAAGTTLASLEAGLGAVAIVRSMPNTPAQIGRGITGAVASRGVSRAQKDIVDALLAALGEVAWVDDEALIDVVTAVSGSGPAYVFHLAECLAEAGADLGLPPELAERLARATVAGAGELLYRSDVPPEELRRNVTSPGGTTAAALDVLMMEEGLGRLMKRAVAAAHRRSQDLSR